jgi:hypothetical protein
VFELRSIDLTTVASDGSRPNSAWQIVAINAIAQTMWCSIGSLIDVGALQNIGIEVRNVWTTVASDVKSSEFGVADRRDQRDPQMMWRSISCRSLSGHCKHRHRGAQRVADRRDASEMEREVPIEVRHSPRDVGRRRRSIAAPVSRCSIWRGRSSRSASSICDRSVIRMLERNRRGCKCTRDVWRIVATLDVSSKIRGSIGTRSTSRSRLRRKRLRGSSRDRQFRSVVTRALC